MQTPSKSNLIHPQHCGKRANTATPKSGQSYCRREKRPSEAKGNLGMVAMPQDSAEGLLDHSKTLDQIKMQTIRVPASTIISEPCRVPTECGHPIKVPGTAYAPQLFYIWKGSSLSLPDEALQRYICLPAPFRLAMMEDQSWIHFQLLRQSLEY